MKHVLEDYIILLNDIITKYIILQQNVLIL